MLGYSQFSVVSVHIYSVRGSVHACVSCLMPEFSRTVLKSCDIARLFWKSAHTATCGQKVVLTHTHKELCDRQVEWCLADRELALFKIGVPHGKARTEILELSDIFSGKVVDVGPEALTVAISGDPGKLFAFETAVQPLGLKQLSRTGRITLLKSDEGLDLPAFGPLAPSKTLERDYERARQGVQVS
jgi:hypothetical protein